MIADQTIMFYFTFLQLYFAFAMYKKHEHNTGGIKIKMYSGFKKKHLRFI